MPTGIAYYKSRSLNNGSAEVSREYHPSLLCVFIYNEDMGYYNVLFTFSIVEAV